MQAIVDREGHDFKLAAWDWWYYAEKVKKDKYDLDDAMLRPYFKMENVRQGAFDVAQKLYGIRFVKREDIQVYQPDVEVFEVLEADGTHIGIFYSDYYPRNGKRSGALVQLAAEPIQHRWRFRYAVGLQRGQLRQAPPRTSRP